MNKKFLLACLLLYPCFLFAQQSVNIIPKPVSLTINNGDFLIDENTSVVFDKNAADLKAAATFFTAYIKNISGYTLPFNASTKKSIHLVIEKTATIGDEGYLLTVSLTSIKLLQIPKPAFLFTRYD